MGKISNERKTIHKSRLQCLAASPCARLRMFLALPPSGMGNVRKFSLWKFLVQRVCLPYRRWNFNVSKGCMAANGDEEFRTFHLIASLCLEICSWLCSKKTRRISALISNRKWANLKQLQNILLANWKIFHEIKTMFIKNDCVTRILMFSFTRFVADFGTTRFTLFCIRLWFWNFLCRA